MIWSQLPGPDGWRSRRYGVSSVRKCQRMAPFVSGVYVYTCKGHGAQPLWAGHCEIRAWDLSIGQGLRIAQPGNVKRQDGKEASCCGSSWGSAIGTLGVSKRSRNRRRGGQGGRDARSWDLCPTSEQKFSH